jgi:hypothetical protein
MAGLENPGLLLCVDAPAPFRSLRLSCGCLSASYNHKYSRMKSNANDRRYSDSLYRRLKSAAALRGCSVKDLVLRGVKAELQVHGGRHRKKPVRLPIIASKRPGSLRLTNCKINEILFP